MTNSQHIGAETDGIRAEVYPLVAGPGNDRVLRKWLDTHDRYRATDPSVRLSAGTFDIVVVDHQSLVEYADELRALKDEQYPELLPVLLLLPDRRMDLDDADSEKLPDNVFPTTVDEIVSTPIRQTELDWRIGALCRLREQSQTVSATAEELRRFREAVEASGHAVYITDIDGEIQYVNPAFEEITGYNADEAIGATPALFHAEETIDEQVDSLWNTILDGETYEGEFTNRRKDGSLYTAHQTIAPLERNDDVTAFVAVQADITELRTIERERRQAAEIIERLEDPIMLQDADGEFLLFNDAVREYAGLTESELDGETERPFMDERSAEQIAANKRTVLETETPLEYEISPTFEQTGREPTFSTRRYPYYDRDGDIAGTIAICRDVTDLKEHQRELRQYKRAITEANDLIAAVGIDEQFLFANPKYCEYFDHSAAELTEQSLSDLYSESEYETISRGIERTLDGESVQYRTTRTHPTRGERTLDVRYHPLREEDETVIGVVGVLRDITETEEKSRQLRVVDQILRHNLRNSLQLIRGYGEQVREQTTEDGEFANVGDRIVKHCDELLTTSHKSRAITKVLNESTEIERLPLGETITTVAESVGDHHPDADLEVRIPAPVDALAIPQIGLAIEELLSNAIVHNDRMHPTVSVSVRTDDDEITIQITDDGPGIPEMDRAVMEDGQAVGDLYHGSGLGLWLVYWIVTHSGGTIVVTEREPRGSVITLSLSRPA